MEGKKLAENETSQNGIKRDGSEDKSPAERGGALKHEFDINMETGDVFAFLMRLQYTGARGLIPLGINIAVILCLVLKWGDYELTPRLLLIFILVMLDVYSPIVLYFRAKAQAKGGEAEKTRLHYIVTDEGISVIGEDESLELQWGHIQQYKATAKRAYVFTSKVSAFIFPKKQVGAEGYAFLLEQLKKNKSDFGMKSLNTAKYSSSQEDEKLE